MVAQAADVHARHIRGRRGREGERGGKGEEKEEEREREKEASGEREARGARHTNCAAAACSAAQWRLPPAVAFMKGGGAAADVKANASRRWGRGRDVTALT